METQGFESMGLKRDLLEMIRAKGFNNPTPIQLRAIPMAMAGFDLMGQAQTGTGKTASFGIPILNKIEKGHGIQALIICPTRELAVQVCKEIAFLGKRLMINTLAVYGGQPIERQIKALDRSPEIIVGTPGRLLDHLERNTICLSCLNFLVLDEADEMLDMGFLPDIEKIIKFCPAKRQTFLFSATLEDEVRELGKKYMQDPQIIEIESPERTVAVIEQRYYNANPRKKYELLCSILDTEQPPASLVFCRTKKCVDQLVRKLDARGYDASGLHGDMSQRERDNVMYRFRHGNVKILVATDLAARGLDISHVSHVINYDIPEDCESYVHRIGRTGRAGREGIAITLVEPAQMRQLRAIEFYTGKSIKRHNLPIREELLNKQQDLLINRIQKILTNESLSSYQVIADRLLQEQHSARDLLAAALKLLVDNSIDLETIDLEAEAEEMAHAELSLGRLNGLTSRSLVDFLEKNTSLSPSEIGDVEVNSRCTYVEVPISRIDEVYEAIKNYKPDKKRKPQRHGFKREKREKINVTD